MLNLNLSRQKIQKALIEIDGYIIVIYFTLIIFIGTYFLKNFILGVFQNKVTLLHTENESVMINNMNTKNKTQIKIQNPLLRCKTIGATKRFQKDSDHSIECNNLPILGQLESWNSRNSLKNNILQQANKNLRIEIGRAHV